MNAGVVRASAGPLLAARDLPMSEACRLVVLHQGTKARHVVVGTNSEGQARQDEKKLR